jgi:hypothetical protein
MRIRLVAALLIVALATGPAATHLYWMLGGTWGLGGRDSSTGIRVVAAVVVVLIVAAVLVVLVRIGLWQQPFVSDRVTRILAWGLAGFFLVHALASFAQGWAGIADEWWLYGPGGLVIGLLALLVATNASRELEEKPANQAGFLYPGGSPTSYAPLDGVAVWSRCGLARVARPGDDIASMTRAQRDALKRELLRQHPELVERIAGIRAVE